MKFKTILILLSFILSLGIHERVLAQTTLNKSDQRFLKRAADARMMDWAEGNLAVERATNIGLKEYGQRMLREQDAFMNAIKALAAKKNFTLPQALREQKSDGLDDLQEETGKSFDKKFIKMMIIDHKRDVKDFKKATKSDDPDIRTFAANYLPVVEEHLNAAKKLKDKNT